MNLPATLTPATDDAAKVAAAVAAAQGTPESPKVEAKPEPKAEPKVETKAEPKVEPAETKHEVLDDEDELKPDAEGMVRMTIKSFMRRVSSMSRANLRKQFGTDNVEQIVEERKELEKLRAEKAENEKAKLTEVERLKLEKKEAEDRADKAVSRADERELRSVAREVDATLKTFAKSIVDKEYVDVLLLKVAREASRHDDIKTPRQAMKWMEDYIKSHPKIAKGAAEAKAEEKKAKDSKKETKKEEPAKEPRKVPITNGVRTLKPTPAGAQDVPVLGKMSKDEIFKQTGLKL